ncbi:unnamed protein product, partial [Closterium sp. Naga37s-1]
DSESTAAQRLDRAAEEPSRKRRWVERGAGKGKRVAEGDEGEEEGGSGTIVREVSVSQRFCIHFHHVMAVCAARAREGANMTPEQVAAEIGSAADHWAGDHSGCSRGSDISRCVADEWGPESALYERGGTTHVRFKAWVSENCGPKQMAPYVLGASNWMNESFHSLICKYAPKRIRFHGSMRARIGLTALHWNNSLDREVIATKIRIRRATRVRRGKTDKVLGPMRWDWVDEILHDWNCLGRAADSDAPVHHTSDASAPTTPCTPVPHSRPPPFAAIVLDVTPAPLSTPQKRRRTGGRPPPRAQRAIF